MSVITGSFVFRIEGYGWLNSRIGDYTESPVFEVCEHLWLLRIYPGGSLEAHKEYLSYFLVNMSDRVTRACCKIYVVNQFGENDEMFESVGIRVFEKSGLQSGEHNKYVHQQFIVISHNCLHC